MACGIMTTAAISGCTSLTFQEQQQLTELQYQGITVDRAPGGWDKPASPLMAGLLNLLPGFGNFYLAAGNAGDSSQWIFGFGNLLTWPISVIWGIPEAAIDANTINKRDMLNFYKYGNQSNMHITIEPAAGPRRTVPARGYGSHYYTRPYNNSYTPGYY